MKRKKSYKTQITKVPKMSPELKKFGQVMGAGGAGMGSVGAVWYEHDMLGQIVAGTDFFNRVGRRIGVHSITIRGVIAGGATGVGGVDDLYNTFRLAVLRFGAAKSGGALLPLNTLGMTLHQPINKSTVPGFVKLYKDHYYAMSNNPWAAGFSSPATVSIDFYKKFKQPSGS